VDFSTRYASAPELGIDATAATSRVTLIGTSGNDRLTGSAFDDVLFGGPGDDVLAGGGGFDTVSYAKVTRWMRVDLETGVAIGEGRDTLNGIEAVIGSDFNDSLRGDALGNALYGGVGDDQIWGRAGDDRLFGGDGADVLYGGLGADRLTGGAGPDTFLFRALAESTLAGDGRDRIMDFDQAGGDLIDLRDIDANLRAAGDQAFTFIGSAPFSGTPGELRTALIGTTTVLMGDVNGDRVAELAISLDGAPPLTASGLLL
jgi:Ca2+-binding RTX toxin-like protein